jgi:hypothetical protein
LLQAKRFRFRSGRVCTGCANAYFNSRC